MKKIMALALAALFVLGAVMAALIPVFAEEKMVLVTPDFKVLTLNMAQDLAVAAVDGNQAYQKKLEEIKKEEEKLLSERFARLDNEYDPKEALKDYQETLDDLKKAKRRRAIDYYSGILASVTQLEQSKNLLETATLALKAAEIQWSKGLITQDVFTKSKISQQQAAIGVKNAQTAVDVTYRQMNTLLNFTEESRYQVDTEDMMAVLGKGNNAFVVPLNLDSEEWKDFKAIKDMQKNIDDKETALRSSYSPVYAEAPVDEKAERAVDLPLLREKLTEKRRELYTSMQKSYNLGIRQMEDLSQNYRTLQLAKLRYELDQKTFNLGQISKAQLLQKEGVYLKARNVYENQVISLYKAIEDYNKAYTPDTSKSGGTNG